MKSWIAQYRTPILVIAALICWSAVVYFISPESLVESVGIGNAYLLSFCISLMAGFSVFTGTAAYATVIEFTRGGVNPLYLGLIAGVGLFLSDSIFYVLVMRGREALAAKFGKWLQRFQHLVDWLPDWVVYLGVYLFCAFGPIPNDVMMATMIICGYQYKKLWPALLAGDITFMLFLSYIFHVA